MKICLINTYDSTGGAAIACRRLMRALNQSEGVEASMLVASGKTDDDKIIRMDKSLLSRWHFKTNLIYERLQFKPYHNREINEFYFSPANSGMDLSSHPEVQSADIIHLHWINLGFLSIKGIRQLAKLKKPIVWTLHDMWAFTGGCHYSGDCDNFRNGCGNCLFLRSPGKSDLSSKLNAKKSFFKDFNYATCSTWLKNEAIHSSILQDANVTSIPNPIDTELFKPADRRKARQLLQLEPDKKYILFAAANLDDKRKGFEYLIQSLKLLAPKVKDGNTELLLFGKQIQDNISLPLKVNALGALDSMEAIANAYQSADVFVIPSLQDNLPNTIMEAMACGTPAVGFDTGGIPEMIDHRQNGYIAHFKDADDLAEGMEYVLSRPELGTAAREKVMNNYQPLNIASQYTDFYRSLLS